MLETALIFAAGFLAAAVLALMILPGVNTRASRLARHRLMAQFPISIEELTAQMDYVRAEGAVEARKLERQLVREREAHARTRGEMGKEDAARSRELLDLRETIERLTAENAELKTVNATVTQDRDEKATAIEKLQVQLTNANVSLNFLRRNSPNAPKPEDIIRENALLRKRIEAVASDLVTLVEARAGDEAKTAEKQPAA